MNSGTASGLSDGFACARDAQSHVVRIRTQVRAARRERSMDMRKTWMGFTGAAFCALLLVNPAPGQQGQGAYPYQQYGGSSFMGDYAGGQSATPPGGFYPYWHTYLDRLQTE